MGLFAACMLALAAAQASTAYEDLESGLTFQQYLPDDQGQNAYYAFGVALPDSPADEFIGQLSGPINGWAGISLGGDMVNNLLLHAWVHEGKIVHGFRMADGKFAAPPLYEPATVPLPVFTRCSEQVLEDRFVLTFKCEGCNAWEASTGDVGGVDLAGEVGVMGWALGTEAVYDPADPGSDLEMHSNQGMFAMLLKDAKSEGYAGFQCGGGNQTVVRRRPRAWGNAARLRKKRMASEMVLETSTDASSAPNETATAIPVATGAVRKVQPNGQCGGITYKGPTVCVDGYQCMKKSDMLWQCLMDCPHGHDHGADHGHDMDHGHDIDHGHNMDHGNGMDHGHEEGHGHGAR